MGLDITLKEPIKTYYIDVDIWSAGITHNLAEMAEAANLYLTLWRPEELFDSEPVEAFKLISMLEAGLENLQEYPDLYKTYNPPNGWGDYENLVSFVTEYLEACKKYPKSLIHVSR